MSQIINDNILLIMIVIAGVIIFIYTIIKSNEIRQKYVKKANNLLTEIEYGILKDKSEKAINNTTISFTKQFNERKLKFPEDLYINTILVGNDLIKKETFSISKVGKI